MKSSLLSKDLKEINDQTIPGMLLNETIKNYLPSDFSPTIHDVVCARGKEAYMHPGNKRYRDIISKNLKNYVAAKNKNEKSLTVLKIVEEVRNNAPAGFIRFCNIEHLWYEIGDDGSREKVGQTIRETLTQQDPKKRAKQRRKRAINKAKRVAAQKAADLEPIPLSQAINNFHTSQFDNDTNNQESTGLNHQSLTPDMSIYDSGMDFQLDQKQKYLHNQENQQSNLLCSRQELTTLSDIMNQKQYKKKVENHQLASMVAIHPVQSIEQESSSIEGYSEHPMTSIDFAQHLTQPQIVDILSPLPISSKSILDLDQIFLENKQMGIISTFSSSSPLSISEDIKNLADHNPLSLPKNPVYQKIKDAEYTTNGLDFDILK